MRNEFFQPDGKPAATVSSVGSWLDLSVRKLVAAPPKLLEALKSLPQTSDFRPLASILEPRTKLQEPPKERRK